MHFRRSRPRQTEGVPVSLNQAVLARLDATVRFVMRDQHIGGLVVGVSRDGVTAFVRGYGYADRTHRRRVDAQTVFAIGSLTKSFTAALVRSELQPDDALARYVPSYPNAREITIDELLRGRRHPRLLDGGVRSLVASRSPKHSSLAAMRPAFAPERLVVLNGNYLLAAYAYQCASGAVRALQRRILRPLASTHAVANPFVPESNRRRKRRKDPPPGFGTEPAVGRARLLAWYGALDEGRTVKSPRYLPQYADGFYDGTAFGQPIRFAQGYVAGFSAYGATLPKEHASVVVLANEDAVDLDPLARTALALALGLPEASPDGAH